MKEEFKALDSERATLRLLLCLAYECPCHPRTELRNSLRKHGVGGTAFMASLDRLRELGLIQETTRDDGRRVTVTCLTEKGVRVAEKVSELYDAL